MNCPGCSGVMTDLPLDARLGTSVEVDMCAACRAIWFDRYEDLQLSPAATLKLFGMIGEPSPAGAAPLPPVLRCPRCQGRLLHTHDLQRNTPFKYWRCDAGHGRLMTFIDFLRAKDFVKPLTPQQLHELRQNVQTINCSNCGGTIDIGKHTVCAYCGSAVSMVDMKGMARTIEQLQAAAGRQAERKDAAPSPTDIDALIAAIRTRDRDSRPTSLIETGLEMLGDLLRTRR